MTADDYIKPLFVGLHKGWLPYEETLAIPTEKRQFTIGVPCETYFTEKCVPLTPEGVELLTEAGHTVLIEKNAGKEAFFDDIHYSEKGAIITDRKNVLGCDIVLKIARPVPDEIKQMKDGSIFIYCFHCQSFSKDALELMIKKQISVLVLTQITNIEGVSPIHNSTSPIAGKAAILMAAELLSSFNKGKGVLLGNSTGISPAEVVVLGTGTIAEHAIKVAIALGACVKVFDNSLKQLSHIQHLVQREFFTSALHPQALKKAFKTADVVIGTPSDEIKNNPLIIEEELIKTMKKGSVLIDLTFNNGGWFETSECHQHGNKPYVKHGVTHYVSCNICTRVAHTASIAFSNSFLVVLEKLSEYPSIASILTAYAEARSGVIMYRGVVTNEQLAKKHNLPWRSLDLLLGSSF